MRRVLVIGCSGAGKSTLAARLAGALGLPLIHLDREYWRAGWRPTPDDEFAVKIARLIERPRWVIDGNYGRTLDLRLQRADTVVHLDFPRWRCLAGVLKRTFRACNFEHRARPDMADGCPERWDWEFIEWIWDFGRTIRPATLATLARHAGRVNVVTLTNREAVRQFVEHVARAPSDDDYVTIP